MPFISRHLPQPLDPLKLTKMIFADRLFLSLLPVDTSRNAFWERGHTQVNNRHLLHSLLVGFRLSFYLQSYSLSHQCPSDHCIKKQHQISRTKTAKTDPATQNIINKVERQNSCRWENLVRRVGRRPKSRPSIHASRRAYIWWINGGFKIFK